MLFWVRARVLLACFRAKEGVGGGSKRKGGRWKEKPRFLIFKKKKKKKRRREEAREVTIFWILEGKGGEEIVGVRRSRRGARRGYAFLFCAFLEKSKIMFECMYFCFLP